MVKFEELKGEIEKAIRRKVLCTKFLDHESGFILIDGFIELYIKSEFNVSKYDLEKTMIPLVGLIGHTTGILYQIPLKFLLPDIDI